MIDWSLRLLIENIERDPSLALDVVLAVNGSLLSGRVIQRRKFLTASFGKETAEELLKQYDEDVERSQAGTPDDKARIHFIHLEDAQFFGTARAVGTPGTPQIIRVNLAHVTAYFFAKLSSPPS